MILGRFGVFLVGLSMPCLTFAFDSSCFRESATLTSHPLTSFQVAFSSPGQDIFFVQGGQVLPSRIISTEKNPPVSYTLKGIPFEPQIHDFDSETVVELDPYELSEHDITIDIDLGRVFSPGSIESRFDYSTSGKSFFFISEDGIKYAPVSQSALRDFSFRYIRLTFEKVKVATVPAFIREITFFENVDNRVLVKPRDATPIKVYKGLICDPKNFITPTLDESLTSGEFLSLVFKQNTEYKNDYDNDGIENIYDVCPYVSDANQLDRNYDGRGDACSDDDHDGVSGAQDNCPTVPNTDQADKNVNNVGDACEFDTDSDGISDATDNAIHVKNPDQKDTDHDNIGDVIDNCTLYNPDQLDLDKNGKGDVCDRDAEYRKTNDIDNDGVLDFSDNCRKISNPDQSDTDRDGIGDVCDNCQILQNPDQLDLDKNGKGDMCEDVDADGIEGWRDNCPEIKNPLQEDADNNHVGDACTDTDSDTILDSSDNCPTQYNKEQNDIDKDGKGDVCDTDDDRFLESNKYLFMGLIGFFGLLFIGGIGLLLKKLQ